jgi:predicted O-methyltransferase YrrM
MKWSLDLTRDIRTFTEFDDVDNGPPHPLGNHQEITDCNRYNLLSQFLKVRDNAQSILEIGVGRNADKSFVHVFTQHKKKETVYIGLDIEDRSFLRDLQNNIHTVQNNSSHYLENVSIFNQIGVTQFDFIFIDGWHSINQVLVDWEYTNLLSDGGIVGFHDTTCHPGPNLFVNALDRGKWEVIENCCPEDWGIGFARKK